MSETESELKRQRRKAAELEIRVDTVESLVITCLAVAAAIALLLGMLAPVAVGTQDGSGLRPLLFPLQLMELLQDADNVPVTLVLLLGSLLMIASVVTAVIVGVIMIGRNGRRPTLVAAKVVGAVLLMGSAVLIILTVNAAMGENDNVAAGPAAWWFTAGAAAFCASWWHEPLRGLWYSGS